MKYELKFIHHSSYLENCIKQSNLQKYSRNKWRNSSNKKLNNLDLIQQIYEFSKQNYITCQKIKAHNNDALNMYVDYYAKEQAEILKLRYEQERLDNLNKQFKLLEKINKEIENEEKE